MYIKSKGPGFFFPFSPYPPLSSHVAPSRVGNRQSADPETFTYLFLSLKNFLFPLLYEELMLKTTKEEGRWSPVFFFFPSLKLSFSYSMSFDKRKVSLFSFPPSPPSFSSFLDGRPREMRRPRVESAIFFFSLFPIRLFVTVRQQ